MDLRATIFARLASDAELAADKLVRRYEQKTRPGSQQATHANAPEESLAMDARRSGVVATTPQLQVAMPVEKIGILLEIVKG